MEVTQKEWQKNGATSVHCHRTMLDFLLSFRFFSGTLLIEIQNVEMPRLCKLQAFLVNTFYSLTHNETGMKIRKYKHCVHCQHKHRKSHPCLTPTPSSSSPCAASEFARLSKGSAAAPDRSVVCLCNACSGLPEAGGLRPQPTRFTDIELREQK